jgi:hypothetical protein
MLKRYGLLLAFLGLVLATQYACAPLAAGVGGAAVGAAAQKHHDKQHDDDD